MNHSPTLETLPRNYHPASYRMRTFHDLRESFLDGTRIWSVWTSEGIEGKEGKVKSEEFRDYDSFQKQIVYLHNTRTVQGYKRRSLEAILSVNF